eukprot:6331109-Prymnesium_polylepis.1
MHERPARSGLAFEGRSAVARTVRPHGGPCRRRVGVGVDREPCRLAAVDGAGEGEQEPEAREDVPDEEVERGRGEQPRLAAGEAQSVRQHQREGAD